MGEALVGRWALGPTGWLSSLAPQLRAITAALVGRVRAKSKRSNHRQVSKWGLNRYDVAVALGRLDGRHQAARTD